jgi:hypothetical protein
MTNPESGKARGEMRIANCVGRAVVLRKRRGSAALREALPAGVAGPLANSGVFVVAEVGDEGAHPKLDPEAKHF